ncbi:MAG: hypothetical protein A4E56_03120 [Pelotomaculum sp. PtaU1.Bin065]|nr:MAG: hypothetical protein A4E56_03120 [Pelotomaculum sp. PtaU1.Bin065]
MFLALPFFKSNSNSNPILGDNGLIILTVLFVIALSVAFLYYISKRKLLKK